VRVYRINAVGKERRPVVLGTVVSASEALVHLNHALSEYSRAWVTDEQGMDVSLPDLKRTAEKERDA
jgi:hypothetical protein